MRWRPNASGLQARTIGILALMLVTLISVLVWVNQRNLGRQTETDMQATLMEVIGRLNRLPPLPADSDPPVVNLGGGGNANGQLTWYFVQKLPGTPGKLTDYARQVTDIIKPRIESIEGVSEVTILDGSPEQLQIVIDPYRAAQLGLPLTDIAARASRSNDTSGGFVDVGRRQYTLRFEGRYDPDQLRNQVLEWRDGRPVRLGDIADIRVERGPRNNLIIQNGNPAMGIRIGRQNGANVLAALTEVKEVMAELREGPMQALGLDLQQSFDASVFIQRAVNLVTGNLLIGVLLAVGEDHEDHELRSGAVGGEPSVGPHDGAADGVQKRRHAARLVGAVRELRGPGQRPPVVHRLVLVVELHERNGRPARAETICSASASRSTDHGMAISTVQPDDVVRVSTRPARCCWDYAARRPRSPYSWWSFLI